MSYTAIEGDGRRNVCLLGNKTTAVVWFAMIDFLRITLLSCIWLVLFLSETIFDVSSKLPHAAVVMKTLSFSKVNI